MRLQMAEEPRRRYEGISAASSTSSAATSVTWASAGTMSPSAGTRTSPVTTSAAGICRCSPSRTTRASGRSGLTAPRSPVPRERRLRLPGVAGTSL